MGWGGVVAVAVGLICCCVPVTPHGRLIEPPSRASMWRYGFNSPPDYNDHESYCGGFTRQWVRNGGKCGICGDAWDSPQPRAHEGGGKYGQGIIVRRYKRGSPFIIRVEITANHRGHFEFRLCKQNAPKQVATQHCLDQHLLERVRTSTSSDTFHPTRYYVGSENKVYEMRYMLPPDVTCSQCVLQWRYFAANNWGNCGNGTSAVGCGPQEEFRACADIAIEDKDGSSDETPYKEKSSSTPQPDDNEVDVIFTEPQDQLYGIPFIIMLGGLFLAIFVYILLFVYYYGANKTVKPCWQRAVQKLSCVFKRSKEENIPPVPPPRTKKLPSLSNDVFHNPNVSVA